MDHRRIHAVVVHLRPCILLGLAKERLDAPPTPLAQFHRDELRSQVVCDDVLIVMVTVSGPTPTVTDPNLRDLEPSLCEVQRTSASLWRHILLSQIAWGYSSWPALFHTVYTQAKGLYTTGACV